MADLEWILALLLGAVLLAALARRIGVPSPALLALGGAAIAFIPNGPRFSLDPNLALALFVAPVLLDAAFDSSLRDLKVAPGQLLRKPEILAVSITVSAAAVSHLRTRHQRTDKAFRILVAYQVVQVDLIVGDLGAVHK